MGSLLKSVKGQRRRRNIRFFYHISSLFDLAKPRFVKQWERNSALAAYHKLSCEQRAVVDRRIALYNQLPQGVEFDYNHPKEAVYKLSDLKMHAIFNGRRSNSVYCYDTLKYMRCYDKHLKGCFVFGDVWWTPHQPSFVKSRPIGGDNTNSVVLPLNHIRHFNFVDDPLPFTNKRDMLIGISYAAQPHRQEFLRLHFGKPLCRLGSALHFEDERKVWSVDFVSISEQLQYKFILCLEGFDVATNLKWVMSSNSIAVMPKPKYESWFMESELVGGVHYIEIEDDYSDLEERLNYYINHPEEAQCIVDAAHSFIDQFGDRNIERITSMKVVEEYFKRSNQI